MSDEDKRKAAAKQDNKRSTPAPVEKSDADKSIGLEGEQFTDTIRRIARVPSSELPPR